MKYTNLEFTKTLTTSKFIFISKVLRYFFIDAICDTLRDLPLFVQFKRHEKLPWRSVSFSKVAGYSLQFY